MLEQIRHKYGSRSDLRKLVKAQPENTAAKIALSRWDDYEDSPTDEPIKVTRELVIPDDAIDRLTQRRVRLLLALKRLKGPASVRELARALGRDVKHVSEDVIVLEELGLIHIDAHGHGRAHEIYLPASRIDLHLVEA
ncbi:MAG: HVO_A0114 family putative DNA-binding protein [Thermoplasmatota archaeon]